MILAVRPRSTATRLGFRARDVVQQVGRDRIRSVVDLERLNSRQRGWFVMVKRGGQVLLLQLPG